MSEGPPKMPEGMTKLEYILLAEELGMQAEGLPFPGIDANAYAKMKADEANPDPNYPDTTTSIDERVRRLHEHGMNVVLGKNPESGNVYILPRDSDDIEKDGLFPKHLNVQSGMDPRLMKLIEASKKPLLKNLIVLPAEHKIKPSFQKKDIISPTEY
ncbi:hypothetical protein HYT04_00115 [Candidatus Kaiserbacteria bacterium]|nr:hypothetical protein [Candidatus Kaiserbacteria bacterium]